MMRQLTPHLLLLASFFYGTSSWGQCGCDHVLTGLNTNSVNIFNASSFTYSPGDVFCIQADTVAGLRFVGFQGTASQPLIFQNCDGLVVVEEGTYSGIDFQGCQYVHLTGTGDSSLTYGIEVASTGNGSMGVNVGSLSSDAEIDHIEIHDVGFAGIMAKTDPNCNNPMTWRRNGYVLQNLDIHHNYIHDTEGEGMYLGYTGGYKVSSNKTCNGDTVFGHWLENVDVHHNILENCGWDAIQVNLVRSNGRIHHNRSHNAGIANQTFQNFAMSIGGGIYEIYNNFFWNDAGAPGKGMQMISGESGCKLYNNVFVDMQGHAIFLHNRHKYDDPNLGYLIANNTIIRPGASAILYNSTITQSLDSNEVGFKQDQVPLYFYNNLVTSPACDYESQNFWKKEPECYFDFNNRSTRDSQLVNIAHNLTSRRLDTLGVLDSTALMFQPLGPTGPLIDAGMDLLSFGVTVDHRDLMRPVGTAFDIGAYEYAPLLSQEAALEDLIRVYPNPATGWVRVEGPGLGQVEVWNLLGQRVEVEWDGQQLDFLDHEPGLYLLVLQLESGQRMTKRVLLR